jgi:phospholipid/cholesterol/gamma-HCH transport system substrate-binding protein
MISTATRIKVLVFALITVVGVAYVAIRYVRVGDAISSGSYSLYADFGTGGGIFTHASVDYRGFPVGKVGSVSLLADGVRVQLILSEGTRVPTGTSAVVVPRSAVGEQYVDLRPDKETGSYLAAGDVIPRERTGGPLPLETLLVNLDDLVRSINADDVASVLDELGKAFEGNELALQKLLDASSLLVDEALRHKDSTLALIRDGRTALAAEADSSSAIRAWAHSLAQLAESVRKADPDLRGLLGATPPAVEQLTGLLKDLDPSVGTLLANLITVTGVTATRLPGVRQMLILYPTAIEIGYTIFGSDGTAQGGWVADTTPKTCTATSSGLNCPAGSGIRDTANVHIGANGLVLTSDGLPLLFGDTGGQSRLAGAQSWKALLLGGVTP